MVEQLSLAPAQSQQDQEPTLAQYAQQAYLEYALSVVKGRALPDVCDGQKPVQRRILYSMLRMGLGFNGSHSAHGAKPVKSARVVGDVLGRFHPHGDIAAYDALVRMAQDFSQRYPLIDGQGNFGSRDGDGAAAMRYTEARLSKIANLLLDEIDQGTVDFVPNYDGSAQEPHQLPSRLPFNLLNGASGIAVGMATEIPSHNLKEIANACIALIKNPKLDAQALYELVPGPDFATGAQIISHAADIAQIYSTGRGSLKVRAKYSVEELARNQWQVVIDELPPNVSARQILQEIEELTNPKVKTGKKALSQEQIQLKATVLSVLDVVRDESNKEAHVRLVFEPKSSRTDLQELMAILLAHTSLENSYVVNLTCIGLDGRPMQKSLQAMLQEWIAFRRTTIERRSQFRLEKVLDRVHVLEGRRLVLLHIDEVIHIIRNSDEPKEALIAHFALSDRQAEDILEIRLRQLARLEAIKIEQELKELLAEQATLEDLLANENSLKRLMIKEIEKDSKEYQDERRTLIQEEKKASVELKVSDEPVTVVVSQKGWVRVRTGHGHDAQGFTFKAGDALYATFECRTVDHLLGFGNNGRVYCVPVAQLPGARGDGQPLTTLIDLEKGTQIVHYYASNAQSVLLLACSNGYGFFAQVQHMVSRQKAGKSFISVGDSQLLCPKPINPIHLSESTGGQEGVTLEPHSQLKILCAAQSGRLLSFSAHELKFLAAGGKGLMLMDLESQDTLVCFALYQDSVLLQGFGRGGKIKEEQLDARALSATMGTRARKGKPINLGFKLQEAVGE